MTEYLGKSLVLCLAVLLFSSQLLLLFQMSTKMLENTSILISTFTGWKTYCGMGLNGSHASSKMGSPPVPIKVSRIFEWAII